MLRAATNMDLGLYYFPLSYYSQKVLLALFEKNVTFSKHHVFVGDGETSDPWYMQINPKGKVPVLRDGNKLISESEDIIDYLDDNISTGPRLVPDKMSSIGKNVDMWRKKLDAVPVARITYGVNYQRDLSVSGLKMPRGTAEEYLLGLRRRITHLVRQSNTVLELRDAYLLKAQQLEELTNFIEDKSKVAKQIDELESVLDEVEKQLSMTSKEQGVPNVCLLGSHYTAADITLTVLLLRIVFLGLEPRCITEDKRPLLCGYFKRMEKRESFKSLQKDVKSVKNIIFKQKLKKVAPYLISALVVLVAVGAAYVKFQS